MNRLHPRTAQVWQFVIVVSVCSMSALAATGIVYAQDEPAVTAATEPAAGTQVELTFKTSDEAEVPLLVYLPKNFDTESGDAYPLIFFLHGRGESNGPPSLVAKWGPPMMAARGDDLPFVIVSPQCPKEDRWASDTQQKRLAELLDDVVTKYKIDEERIFLTGLSMGGYGSWTMAARQPDRFAAVAPVCGGGNVEDAEKLKDVPIWAFHGSDDSVVPLSKSTEMVDAIKEAGGSSIRLTTYEHLSHNSWSPTYAMPDLYYWMEKQAKKEAVESRGE
jgi:predicted peptidase